jgi:hypothetical protein
MGIEYMVYWPHEWLIDTIIEKQCYPPQPVKQPNKPRPITLVLERNNWRETVLLEEGANPPAPRGPTPQFNNYTPPPGVFDDPQPRAVANTPGTRSTTTVTAPATVITDPTPTPVPAPAATGERHKRTISDAIPSVERATGREDIAERRSSEDPVMQRRSGRQTRPSRRLAGK